MSYYCCNSNLTSSEVEPFFIGLLGICISFSVNYLYSLSHVHFLVFFVFVSCFQTPESN